MSDMKWSKQLTPEQLEQYRQQQKAKHEANKKRFASLSPEEQKRRLPPLPETLVPAGLDPRWRALHGLSFRAKVLLEHVADGDMELSAADLAELKRIAAVPRPSDTVFLGEFDAFYEAWEGGDEVK
jgi:hypothetical protein